MTLKELIERYRIEANDLVEPYFFADSSITSWLNDAETEAAIRGRLLHESASASICSIGVSPGTATYKLHPALYEIDHIAFVRDGAPRREPIRLVSTEELDRVLPRWRDEVGDPEYAIQTDKQIRLVPTPLNAGTIKLEGYRLPMSLMEVGDDEPEINSAHHRHLVQWALHIGFSVPDTETFDSSRSGMAEIEFNRYFGQRPDSDLRRITREDVQHHVTAFWP
jgi:hypothetical protein